MKTRRKQRLSRNSMPTVSVQRCSPNVAPAGLVVLWALSACAADGSGSEPSLLRLGQDIIGGVMASSAELDHTGALVAQRAGSDELAPFCTATLIGPETVVTAKHCAVVLPDIARVGGELPAFAVGPDAATPRELIPIVDVQTAPGIIGGFVEMGRDVAVLHLEHATAIEPAAPRRLSASFLGTPMVSIGYGVHRAAAGPNSADTLRRIGRETIAATEGRILEAFFGSFEGYVEATYPGQTVESIEQEFPGFLDADRRAYDETLLFEQHEAVTGTAESDSQICYGDSGGPLARPTATGWETYGVVSGGLGSLRSQCDYGTVYSTFGPKSLAFIEDQMAWVDPCGDVTSAGECLGNTARTCETNIGANIRRLIERDCGALGLTCVSSEDGTGCGSAPNAPPVEGPSSEQRAYLFERMAIASRPKTILD